ncbi:MAG: 2-oxoglutarate dehydrogenase complex dihydrolipoyllysine-residue succinyltransferase [Deltaproteobacteria bacterium]|nr:MAG: 2-oxoglutarate dehydrogenase complex dihydrolipoyllysine-residue succinyltransferase [Deltaproteobacteria bacterium]
MKELVVPELGESITEAVVAKWLVEPGQAVEADEPLVDLETDKVTVQLPAPAAGQLVEVKAREGDTVSVGQVIGLFEPAGVAAKKPQRPAGGNGQPAGRAAAPAAPAEPAVAGALEPAVAPEAAAAPAAPERTEPIAAPPDAVDDVPERGPDGRVLSPAERRRYRERGELPAAAPASAAAPAPARAPAPAEVTGPDEPEDVVPMSPLRRRIAERLVQAQHTAAILTTFNEVDMSAVMALREAHKDEFLARHGVKLGFMSFFVKACVAALKQFPGVNAEVRGDAIAYKKYYHIGIAVGGGKGLVVPVVRHADRLGFADIERTIADLAQRAQANKLTLDELMGGTFTISNGGVYGSMMSTPLLNMPQTGILGMHNIIRRPVAIGDRIEIRPMMYIALSYDHRVIDGREAVQFLVAVKRGVEHPERLMFEL